MDFQIARDETFVRFRSFAAVRYRYTSLSTSMRYRKQLRAILETLVVHWYVRTNSAYLWKYRAVRWVKFCSKNR